MPMNVILLERVPKLGQMGDVVKVKPGFARNFLLPQKKALRATKDNIAYFESQRKTLEAQNLERRKDAEAVAAKMSDLKVTLIRQASEALQLYGSVTSRDIADAAGAADVKIERSQVELDKPIKSLGAHKIRVHLHPEVTVEISALVARKAFLCGNRKLRANPGLTFTTSPIWPSLGTRSSRMTFIGMMLSPP